MALETQSNSAPGGIPTQVAQLIVQELRESAVLAPLLYWINLQSTAGAAVNVPRATATPAAAAITTGANEADAQANVQLTSDSVTITTAVKAIHFTISDFLISTSQVDWKVFSMQAAVRALVANLETAIATLFSGFSGSNGTTGTDLTVATLDATLTDYGINALEQAEKAVIVLHRKQVGDLRADLIGGTGSALSTIFAQTALADIFGEKPGQSAFANYLGAFYGVPVFQTAYVQKINADADYCGAIFARSAGMVDPNCALAGAWKWLPEVRQYDKGSQNMLAQSTQGRMAYGLAEIKDALGRGIVSGV